MFDIIIRSEEKESYIKINGNTLEGFTVGENFIANLTNEEVAILKLLKLSSNATYLGKVNDFDTYLDNNSGLKHFFKNNMEDAKMFCEYNAVNAIKYQKDYENHRQKNGDSFLIILEKIQRKIELIASGAAIVLLLTLPTSFVLQNIMYNQPTDDQKSYETIVKLVEENTNLDDNEKKIFTNEKLLKDIIPFYKDSTENKIVNVSFKLLNIRYFEKHSDDSILGYYNSLEPGILNIKKGMSPEDEYDTKCHEFCHLLEGSYYYEYICESCSEIISYEYLDCPIDAYKKGVKNVKILMEIMGPRPIWKLIYSNNDEEFVNIIKQNLPREKSARLLKLFTAKPGSSKSIDNEVNSLIEELYYNVKKEDIKDNIYIANMDKIIHRYYFNSDKITQNNPKLIKNGFEVSYDEFMQLFLMNPTTIKNKISLEVVDPEWKEKASSEIDAVKLGYIKVYYNGGLNIKDMTIDQIENGIEDGSLANFTMIELPNIYEIFPNEEASLSPKSA